MTSKYLKNERKKQISKSILFIIPWLIDFKTIWTSKQQISKSTLFIAMTSKQVGKQQQQQ